MIINITKDDFKQVDKDENLDLPKICDGIDILSSYVSKKLTVLRIV